MIATQDRVGVLQARPHSYCAIVGDDVVLIAGGAVARKSLTEQ